MSCRQKVLRRILVAVVQDVALRAGPRANIERHFFGNKPTVPAAFTAGIEAINHLKFATVPFAFVGQHLPKRGKPHIGDAAGQILIGHHAAHVQIFDAYHIVAADQVRRHFVEVILAGVGNVRMQTRDFESLAQPAATPLCTAAEHTLDSRQFGELAPKVFGIGDPFSAGESRQPIDAEIYPHALSGLGLLLHFFVQTETHKVSARTILDYRDGAGFTLKVSGPADAQVTKLSQGEVLLIAVPLEGGTGELRALRPPLRFEAGISRPLLEEVTEGSLQVPEALLKRNTGDLTEPVKLRFLFPLGQGGAGLLVVNAGFVLRVAIRSQIQRLVVDEADTTKHLLQSPPLRRARIASKGVSNFHRLKRRIVSDTNSSLVSKWRQIEFFPHRTQG